jgi:antagonist of KipI
VGNYDGAAALEMTLIGGSFAFPDGATIALAGSDFSSPIPRWTAVEMKRGETLQLGPTLTGARCYLCVRGGIKVQPFLGSASTHILSGLGGLGGRALKKGDVLTIGNLPHSTPVKPSWEQFVPRKVLRVTHGPQSELFPALQDFYSAPYRVTEEANRMGLRLDGPPMRSPSGGKMISEGVSLGAIQIPEGGQPIILFVEQQTTGGYPKIANVITADLHSVGQLRPRDEIRFELVSIETARSLLQEQERILAVNKRE